MSFLKKTTIIFLLTIFLLVSLFFPNNNIQAQWVVSDPGTGSLLVWQTVKNIARKLVEEAWKHGGAIAYKNTINFYLGEVAKQSAEYLATGGKGQKPLFLDNPSEYLTNVADNFAGEYIDRASKDILGRSLCDPIDPNIKFQLLISLDEPKMSVTQMGKCSASQVLTRLKGMTLKDLVQFEGRLSSGAPAKFKSDIKIIIASDTVLNKGQLFEVHPAARCHEDGFYTIDYDAIGTSCCPTTVWYCDQEGGDSGPYVNMGVGKLLDIANGLIVAQDDFEKISVAWKSFQDGKFSERVGLIEKEIEETIKEINILTNNTGDCNDASEKRKCSKIEKKKQKYEETLSEIREKIENFGINKNLAIADLRAIEAYLDIVKGEVFEEVDLLPTVANELAFWEKYAKSCQKKDLEDFYSESGCIVIDYLAHGIWANTETLEQKHYPDTIIYTKRIDNYTKQLVEWMSILTDMVEKTKKACIDMSQVPDLDPLEDLNRMYNPESSDLGISLGLKSDLFKKQQEQIEKSKFAQTLKGRIDDATTKISGVTKTPSTLVDESSRAAVKGSDPASMMQYTGVAVADALGVFTNTLMSKLLSQVFEKGFNKNVDPDQVDLSRPDDVASSSGDFYSELKTAFIDETKEEVNMYNEFAVCPGEGYATPTHCLIQDNSFRSAIEQGLTLKQAVEDGYLAGDNAIALPGDTSSQLSYPVIKKLRRFRIFPLGLEIAAEKLFNPKVDDDGQTISITKSLNQLFEEFYKDTDYSHLVDPNWVLKPPVYQCSAKGYSSIPVKDTSTRQKMCIDLKGCINENEQGKCDTWGYCTREKNVWEIEGDICDEQYAGCKTYTRVEDGKRFYYLSQTLNLEGCDYLSSGGCKWYCINQDQTTEDWNCLNPGHVFTFDTGAVDFELDVDPGNVIFFNSNTPECSSKSEGCHEYISILPNTGTNLVVNGSFNKDEYPAPDNFPDQWTVHGPTDAVSQLSAISFLEEQIKISASDGIDHWVQQTINNVPASVDEFVLSGKIKLISYVSGEIGLKLMVHYTDGLYENSYEEVNTNVLNAEQDIFVHLKPDPNKIIDYVIVYGPWSNSLKGEFWGDDIQLEIGNNGSSYKNYGAKNKKYFKAVPNYLEASIKWESCTDDDLANNLDICDKYVIECSSEDLGCNLYTPFNTDDPKVPGIVKEQDKCSSSCLGYEIFQEIPSSFDSIIPQSVNLIPSTAETCSFPGCEEFTNLETEDREYYFYLRQCVKTNTQGQAIIDNNGTVFPTPDDNLCQFYYTWVGIETGYQLKQYYLKKDATGPERISDYEVAKGLWGDCDADNLDNPHCRQFYDASGIIYYRLYKNTITCSENCLLYRKTIPTVPDGITDFMAIPLQGEVCGKSDVGCREYKGPTSGNIKNKFKDDFESYTVGDWVGGETPPSGESVVFPGFSLKVVSGSISRPVKNLVQKDRTYFVSFWIKGTTTVSVEFTSSDDEFTKEELNPDEWQEVKSSPFNFDTEPDDNEEITITSASNFYIDNIILKEVQDNPYLIKDSWSTPTICDQDAEGNYSLGYAIGCQGYRNRDGQEVSLKSFTRLCSESVVGCEAFIDTQNSSESFRQTFNDGPEESPGEINDDVTILKDDLVYFINDSNKKCSSKEVGCQKFGLPELDINQEAKQGMYKSVYLINKPDLYKSLPSLCLYQSLGCEEYDNEKSFKFPGEKICEWRENVDMGDESKTGWFQKGADDPCYEFYETNTIYDIYSNDEEGYDEWVGKCERKQSDCTEFIDPLAQNLVNNNSFELDLNEWPTYYLSHPENPEWANYGVDNSESHAGNKSIKLWSTTGDSALHVYSSNITVKQEHSYSLSAWVKGENVEDIIDAEDAHPWIAMHVYDSAGIKIAGFMAQANTPYGTFDWKRIQSENYMMPINAEYIKLLITYETETTGTVWFDTIKLIDLDSKEASYFYINNNKLDKSFCEGQVGLKAGCILLNDTSNQSLIYNSVASYANSFIKDDELEDPKRDIESGDANIIVKAKRDRVCGEWLTCIGSRYIWDPILEKWREICEFIGRCDKLIGTGQESACGHYVTYSNPEVLTEKIYKSRDISWSGMDYSGYSIYGLYPVEVLFPEEYEDGIYKLTYKEKIEDGPLVDKGIDGVGNPLEKICKIFPEENAPFEREIALDGDGNIFNENYIKVNVCNEIGTGDYSNCQCSYKKVSYTGEDRYYNIGNDISIPKGICISVGGTKKIGADCTINDDCTSVDPLTDPGVCVKKTKTVSAVGLRGFCLEEDKSLKDESYCLTWWLGSGIGDPDIYMNDLSAAFTPDYTWYCQDNINTDPPDPQWTRVTGNHCDSGVGGGNRSCRCEDETYYITSLPEIIMKEVERINVHIGVDDAGGQCSWDHLDAEGTHDLTEAGDPDNNIPAWTANEEDDSSGNNNFDCNCDKGGACIKIKACFGSDPDCPNDNPEDVLHHFAVNQIDCSYGDASARFDEADIYLKNGCKYMVEIPTDSNNIAEGAYTNRLWIGSNHDAVIGDVSSFYTTECDPYGVAGVSSSPDRLILIPSPTKLDCFEDEANVVHSDTSLKSLFAKVDEKKEFFYSTGTIDYGPCDGVGLGHCSVATDIPCSVDADGVTDDCPIIDYGPCNPDSVEDCDEDPLDEIDCLCTVDLTMPCSYDNNCVVSEGCDNISPGTCSTNASITCFNPSDCIFDTGGMVYSPSGSTWDETETEGLVINEAPTIASVNMSTCDQNDICDMAGENEISVNGMNNTIITKTKSYPVSLKFFVWADKNQMPIRNITIDWIGDKSRKKEYPVVLKNYKPYPTFELCGMSSDNFGDSVGGCITKYLNFTYIYNCEGENSPGWEADFDGDGSPDCPTHCCFKPTVYVKDNWGWCDGGGSGFYAGEDSKCIDTAAGTSYKGLIIIKP